MRPTVSQSQARAIAPVTAASELAALELVGTPIYDARIKAAAGWLAANAYHDLSDLRTYCAGLIAFLDAFRKARPRPAPSTVNGYRAALMASARRRFRLDPVALAAVRETLRRIPLGQPNARVSSERVLSDDEYATLSAAVQAKDARLALLLELLYKTGLRISEALDSCFSDFKRTTRADVGPVYLLTVVGKRQKQRTVFVDVDLYERLRTSARSITGADACPFVFPTSTGGRLDRSNAYRTLSRIALTTLGRKLGPHVARHTFATRKIRQRGGSVKAVSLYLGHSDVATTEKMYNHDELTAADVLAG